MKHECRGSICVGLPPPYTCILVLATILLAMLASSPAACHPAAPAGRIVQRYDRSRYQVYNDEASCITTDHLGHIYVAGQSGRGSGTHYINSERDIVLVKYDAALNLVWEAVYAGTDQGRDFPVDVQTDAQGNVYVAGSTWVGHPAAGSFDIIVLKYDSSGTLVWRSLYSGDGLGNDEAIRIVPLENGRVYVGATVVRRQSRRSLATLCYDSEGRLLWEALFPGECKDITVDQNGNSYVVGKTYDSNTGSGSDPVILRYSSIGVLEWWDKTDDDAMAGLMSQVVCDLDGNIYVAGTRSNDLFVRKYTTDGAILWEQWYDESEYRVMYVEQAVCMEINPLGGIVMLGRSYSPPTQNWNHFLLSFDEEGAEKWSLTHKNKSTWMFPVDCSVGFNGEVHVLGYQNLDPGSENILYEKYNSSGARVWSDNFDGVGNSADIPAALTLGDQGDVYVFGSTYSGSNSGDDFVILRYIHRARPAVLRSLRVEPNRIYARGKAICVIEISDPAPLYGSLLGISSSDRSVIVPSNLVIPEGETSIEFEVVARNGKRRKLVEISATYVDHSVSGELKYIGRKRRGRSGKQRR